MSSIGIDWSSHSQARPVTYTSEEGGAEPRRNRSYTTWWGILITAHIFICLVSEHGPVWPPRRTPHDFLFVIYEGCSDHNYDHFDEHV